MNGNGRLRSILRPLVRLARVIHESDAARRLALYNRILASVEEGRLTVRVPEFGGSFEIDFRSHILKRILIDGCYEPRTAALVRRYMDPHRDAIDVGANVGFFTILMSRLGGPDRRVLAIEPTAGALVSLWRNISRNGGNSAVVVFEGVATDADGECSINVIPGMEEYSSVSSIVHPAAEGHRSEKISVQGCSIDTLVKRNSLRPGFIKMDTEGSELQVLRGARQTIDAHRPVIVSELSEKLLSAYGTEPKQLYDFLQSRGYTIDLSTAGELLAIPDANGTGVASVSSKARLTD